MPRPDDPRAVLGATLVLAVAVVVAAIAAGAPGDLLLAVPVLVLAAPLALGRYVGADRLERLARAVRARRLRRRPDDAALPDPALRPRRRLARGGALLACSIAVRPPPAALGSR